MGTFCKSSQVVVIGRGLNKMCRLCLKSNVLMKDMFTFKKRKNIINKITECTSVKISRHDEMPRFLCCVCYIQLIKTYRFRKQALKSDETLRDYLRQLHAVKKESENIEKCSTLPKSGESKNLDVSQLNLKEEISVNAQISVDSIKAEPEWEPNSSIETVWLNPEQQKHCEDGEIQNIKDEPLFYQEDYQTIRDNVKQEIPTHTEFAGTNLQQAECDVEVNNLRLNASHSDNKFEETDDNINLNQINTNLGNEEIFVQASETTIEETKVTSSGTRKLKRKPLECDVCNKMFMHMNNFKRHKLIHTNVKPYHCDVCNKCFRLEWALKTHKQSHTDAHQCQVCNKTFDRMIVLQLHQRTHTGEKPYQCDVCNKCFSYSSNLNKHKILHTGVKPYQCTVCNRYFADASNLKKHSLVHIDEKSLEIRCKESGDSDKLTDEKRFHCNVCSKSFARLFDLKRHNRLHTGEKPYQCDVCFKDYSSSSSLNNHKLSHTGEKPFQCDVCNKCFVRSFDLKRHQREHTGEKPHRCDVCSKCFSVAYSLKKHMLSHIK